VEGCGDNEEDKRPRIRSRVIGLKNGVYDLKIDAVSAGTFNNDELARGVDLALLE